MKKYFLICCAVLLSSAAFAQLPSFDFGIKGGVNLATLKADWADSENRLGYQFGLFTRIGAVGFYVQPEAYLSSKGGELKQESSNISGKVNFTTLDIPLLVGNKIGVDKLNIRFMAGPIISFILKEDIKENFQNATNFRGYKDQTFGGQLGAGVDLGNLTVDLRYEKGFTNIDRSGQYDQKQNLWHLSLGYKIL